MLLDIITCGTMQVTITKTCVLRISVGYNKGRDAVVAPPLFHIYNRSFCIEMVEYMAGFLEYRVRFNSVYAGCGYLTAERSFSSTLLECTSSPIVSS